MTELIEAVEYGWQRNSNRVKWIRTEPPTQSPVCLAPTSHRSMIVGEAEPVIDTPQRRIAWNELLNHQILRDIGRAIVERPAFLADFLPPRNRVLCLNGNRTGLLRHERGLIRHWAHQVIAVFPETPSDVESRAKTTTDVVRTRTVPGASEWFHSVHW